MEKFHKFYLEENHAEKQKYIDEGWIEIKLIFAATKDKTEAEEFFDLAIKNFETKRRKPLHISFHEIQQSPFIGAIIIDALIYDIEELLRFILNFPPIAVELKKEEFEISLATLNGIFLDICDIIKAFEHYSKKEIYLKDTEIKGAEIYANIILEFHNENEKLVEERIKEAMSSIKAVANVISESIDEILEEIENEKKIYSGNVEIELKTNIFTFVDIITQFKPVAIEIKAPNILTMSKNEIYTLIGKLLLIAQIHTEKIIQSEKIADES